MLARIKRAARPGSDEPPAKAARMLARRMTPLDLDCPDTVDPSHFLDGSHLARYMRICVNVAIKALGRPCRSSVLEHRLGSACSGSEMLAAVTNEINDAFKRENISIDVVIPFAIEVDDRKADWGMQVHDRIKGNGARADTCAYKDVSKMAPERGDPKGLHCRRHNRICGMDDTNGLCVGFSCKDFSRFNVNRAKTPKVFAAETSSGKSADTMWGVIDLIAMAHFDWILLENVDAMDDSNHAGDLDVLLGLLNQHGYDSKSWIIDAVDFGLPQRRKRIYILALSWRPRSFAVAEHESFFGKMSMLIEKMKRSPPSFPDCLLPDDAPEVLRELDHRLQSPPKCWDSSTIDLHRKAWKSKAGRWGVFKPDQADVRSPWFQAMCFRERDCLAFHQHRYRKEDHKAVVATVGQSITYETGSDLAPNGALILPTLTPKGKPWVSIAGSNPHCRSDRSIHRFMHGAEELMYQGFPIFHPRFRPMIQDKSSAFLADLAGNAFPGTVIGAIMVAFFFWQSSP
jgi:site-specific DNA-cytosine methylase